MLTESEIIKKLIGTYPNAVVPVPVYQSGVDVDFVETVNNFANNIMRDFEPSRQKYYFGRIFENKKDCAKYLAGFLSDLRDECTKFVYDNFGVDTDGEIYYLGVDNDDD